MTMMTMVMIMMKKYFEWRDPDWLNPLARGGSDAGSQVVIVILTSLWLWHQPPSPRTSSTSNYRHHYDDVRQHGALTLTVRKELVKREALGPRYLWWRRRWWWWYWRWWSTLDHESPVKHKHMVIWPQEGEDRARSAGDEVAIISQTPDSRQDIWAGCMEKLTQYEQIDKFKIDTILQEGGKPEPLGGCWPVCDRAAGSSTREIAKPGWSA